MRIAIFGTGGIGGNYGGYLARAGVDVTFIARGEHLKAIKEHGLEIEGPKEKFLIKPAKASDNPAEIGHVDVIFVCTKAWQLEEAAKAIKPMIGLDTFILPLQNSIEAADFLADRLGAERVLGGLCYTQSYIVRPGVIHGNGNLIILGELNHSLSARTKALEKIINASPGISCENSPNIHFKMWKKFVWICSASAIGAVTRVPAGIWRTLPETRILFETILTEAFAVANAKGAELGQTDFDEIIKFLENMPDKFTTSMQRDMMASSRSELEYQIGAVIRIGNKMNVPTPISSAIYAALLPQELQAQKKI